MGKILTVLSFGVLSFLFSPFSVFASSADQGDTFVFHTFASCQEAETTLQKILPTSYTDPRIYKGVIGYDMPTMVASPVVSGTKSPVSETNIQVQGIDEPDTVKTDGRMIYSYDDAKKIISIIDAKSLSLVKTLRLAQNLSGINLYITKNTLVVIGTKTLQNDTLSPYWYNTSQKSVVLLYDILIPSRPVLLRSTEIDGSLSDSRLSDNGILTLVVSNSFWMPPLYRLASTNISRDTSLSMILPRISDTAYFSGQSRKNPENQDCRHMGTVIPESDDVYKNITPALTSILRYDITNRDSVIQNQIALSDTAQIHVTQDSVYLSTRVQDSTGSCPPGSRCIKPLIWSGESTKTLLHRFAITNSSLSHIYTRTISGTPLTQYSMSENSQGDMRVVTQLHTFSGGQNTSNTILTVLNKRGDILSTLSGIAIGENFQSARFIGERLYLVTFQQIDPLFVIDVSQSQYPKILGELKIPGYSTYLHPYDSERLIGIGYDTVNNQWGGTQNGGIKVDLYNVSDVKNPKQEATLTLGGVSSSSDVLSDPRKFVWYKEKNLLLLPAYLTESMNDPTDLYRLKSAFQGLVGIAILPGSIGEKFRISNIIKPETLESDWKNECSKYTGNKKPVCHTLLDGTQYCTNDSAGYVPNYCFAGSTADSYFASQLWNQSADFVTRTLYIGDRLYTLSQNDIRSWNLVDTTTQLQKLIFPERYPRK